MLIAGIVLACLLISLLLGLFFIYKGVFYNAPRPKELDPYEALKSPYLEGMRDVIRQQIDDLSAYPCEEIRIKSHDGLTLFARYFKGRDGMPVSILFHGYRGSSHTELSGAALMMISHGLGAIVVDQRAHGKSAGRTVSFGVKERHDALAWVTYARERFGNDTKVVLYGISMGASTVLMASELITDSGVAVVADCPYSTPEAIIKRVLQNRGLKPGLLYPFVTMAAFIFGHFRLGSASAVEAVKRTKAPILLIHGKADDFVPYTMSEEIKSASESATLFGVDGAKHGASFAVGQENYVNCVLDFIDRNTK